MKPWEKHLTSIYYDPKEAASFTSDLQKLEKSVKAKNKFVISKAQIKKWLSAQDVDTSLRGVIRKFQRARVILDGPFQLWDMDLIDMQQYTKDNDGYKYVLVVIDDFSRFADAEPIKSKTPDDVIQAIKTIFARSSKLPITLRSDKGTEFLNRKMNTYLKKRGVAHQSTENEVKAAFAERFIKTLKKKMTKYFLHKQNFHYTDVLSSFVESYNKTYHRSIKMAPIKVTEKNKDEVYEELYIYPYWKSLQKKKKKVTRFRYKIGDTVKISHLREVFDREYSQKWTSEVFTITQRLHMDGKPVYKLKDYSGEKIQGRFYQSELQKVVFDETKTFKIDKVLKERGRGQNKESLIRWIGWPRKYDQWVKSKTIIAQP